MARIPVATRDNVPPEQKATFEEILEQRGAPRGPMTIMLNVLEMSKRASHLLAYLRDESTIPHKLQELAMLTTPRELAPSINPVRMRRQRFLKTVEAVEHHDVDVMLTLTAPNVNYAS